MGRRLFGEIACHRDRAAFERPAGDERPQQALRRGQRRQVRDAVGFGFELVGQIRVEQQCAEPRRIELQRELAIVGPDFVGGPLVERKLFALPGRVGVRRPRQGGQCACPNQRIRCGLARLPEMRRAQRGRRARVRRCQARTRPRDDRRQSGGSAAPCAAARPRCPGHRRQAPIARPPGTSRRRCGRRSAASRQVHRDRTRVGALLRKQAWPHARADRPVRWRTNRCRSPFARSDGRIAAGLLRRGQRGRPGRRPTCWPRGRPIRPARRTSSGGPARPTPRPPALAQVPADRVG